MLHYVYLQAFHFLHEKYFRKLYLLSTVGQTRLSSIAIIYIERLMQTTIFRYRWIELLIFLEKEKS